MKFIYEKDASEEFLTLKGENFKHLKARRVRAGELVNLRNLEDGFDYKYEILDLNRSASLKLISKEKIYDKESNLVLAWAVIDPSSIEKALSFLNELGVKKIIFVYADFSQKNFKMDLERFKRILFSSSEQCGRNSIIDFEILSTSKELYEKYENIVLLDFEGLSEENGAKFKEDEIYFVGPEGGFSQNEREIFQNKITFKCQNILRSQTAILSVAAKVLA